MFERGPLKFSLHLFLIFAGIGLFLFACGTGPEGGLGLGGDEGVSEGGVTGEGPEGDSGLEEAMATLIFDYPPTMGGTLDEGLYPVEMEPFAESIQLTPLLYTSLTDVEHFSFENNGSEKSVAPFLYSPNELNVMNLEVLKHQVQAISTGEEEEVKYIWNLVAGGLTHYCAAGDEGFLPDPLLIFSMAMDLPVVIMPRLLWPHWHKYLATTAD